MKVQHSPLYAQLVKVFEDNIRREIWRVGTPIPSESELSRQFGVSVGTARKALEVMEQVGWITRRQGRGTYVSDPASRCASWVSQVLMNDETDVLRVCESSLLEHYTRLPTHEEVEALKIPAGSKITAIQRLFTKESSAVMVEDIMLFEKADETIHVSLEASDALQMVMAQRISQISNVVEQYSAVFAPEKISEILGRSDQLPVLHCRQVIQDCEGIPLAVCDRWIATEGAYCKTILH